LLNLNYFLYNFLSPNLYQKKIEERCGKWIPGRKWWLAVERRGWMYVYNIPTCAQNQMLIDGSARLDLIGNAIDDPSTIVHDQRSMMLSPGPGLS
jgi:hypothetical protein